MKIISESDLCEKFFKPEPMLFMLSLVIFPKQHEGCVSQPKVYKQTHTDSNCDSLMQEVDQWSRDQMWSVPHDSKCLRNPWFLPYFTWQEPSALHPHSHFKAFFSCVFWVSMWISLVYVLQRWLYCWQNERLWQSVKIYNKSFSSNIKLICDFDIECFWSRREFHLSVNLEKIKCAALCKC